MLCKGVEKRMLAVEIYEKDIKVTSIQFQKQFMILVANSELFWEIDGKSSRAIEGGEIHIWIRVEANSEYKLVFVRADWSMSINGQNYPSRFYEDIRIGQHTLELKYTQYRFVCHTT